MAYQLPTTSFKHLVSGRRYSVVRPFKDFDGGQHSPGETWTFIGSAFLPYDDGLSLFIEMDGHTRHIRMQWRDEEQGPIIDELEEYIEKAR